MGGIRRVLTRSIGLSLIALMIATAFAGAPDAGAQQTTPTQVDAVNLGTPPPPPPREYGNLHRANIINGTQVPEGSLPFLASIQLASGHLCGGTLLTASVLVTAAHCVADDDGTLSRPAGSYTVGLGSSNLNTFEQTIAASNVIVHPDYEVLDGTSLAPGLPNADIALLVLATPASLTGDVNTIDFLDLDPALPLSGSQGTVAGWGDTVAGPGENYPDIARQAAIDVVGCDMSVRLIGQICADGPGANSACYSDSGGPLLRPAPGGEHVLTGIVSGGSSDCVGVHRYERLSSHRTFLESVFGPWTAPNGFVSLAPSRILDSRPGHPGQGDNTFSTPWSPSSTIREVQITGIAGVPATGAAAVVAHVTSVGPTGNGYMTAWAAGLPQGQPPTAAAKNFGTTASGQNSHTGVANDLVILPVGPDGTILIGVPTTSTNLVFDVVGYFDLWIGDGFASLEPSRVLDSRPGQPGQGANTFSTPWSAGTTRTVQLTGVGGVPASGVSAVAAYVTSVTPSANSFLTTWASGDRPTTASKNFGPVAGGPGGHTAITNDLLIMPVTGAGTVDFYNNAGAVHFVVDVVGWFGPAASGGFRSTAPSRVLDSRPANSSQGANDVFNTPWGPGVTRQVDVTEVGGVPADASAVLAHVTSVTPTANSYLTIWGQGGQPVAAAKNYGNLGGGPGGHAAFTNDLLVLPVDSSGNVNFYNNSGHTHLVVDIVGYMA